NDTYGAVLPRRATCFRVWSKMDQSKEWLSSMPPLQSGKLFKGAGRLTQKYLSFDFEKLTEHAGNIYLCGCNPYLRGWNKKLLDIDTDLLVSFMERSGRTVEGMKLVLEDFRADNISFSKEFEITAKNLRLNLPHFPHLLRSRLYSREGQLIGYQSGAWANISYVVGTQVDSVNLKVRGHKDISVRKINKRVNQGPIVIGKYDHGAAGYLKDKLQLKELDNLESKGQFVF